MLSTNKTTTNFHGTHQQQTGYSYESEESERQESWTGVTIAHNLTKMKYQEEQIQDMSRNLLVQEEQGKI